MRAADLYQSSKFFFLTLKSLGLAPYQFNKKSQCFVTTFWNYVEMISFTAMWIALTWLTFNTVQSDDTTLAVQSKLLERLWTYQYELQFILASVTIVFNFMKRKHVENFMDLIFTFDQLMSSLDWRFEASYSKYLVFVLQLDSMIFFMTYQCVSIFVFKAYGEIEYTTIKVVVMMFSYTAMIEIYLMLSIQFIMSTYYIKIRLNALIRYAR